MVVGGGLGSSCWQSYRNVYGIQASIRLCKQNLEKDNVMFHSSRGCYVSNTDKNKHHWIMYQTWYLAMYCFLNSPLKHFIRWYCFMSLCILFQRKAPATRTAFSPRDIFTWETISRFLSSTAYTLCYDIVALRWETFHPFIANKCKYITFIYATDLQ